MSFQSKYTELFTIHMFHDYFLDVGLEKFADMNSEEREKELAQFNWSAYIDIQPTTDTKKKLLNQRMKVFKDNTSFKVLLSVDQDVQNKPFIPISSNLQLDFVVRLSDARFIEYSTSKPNSNQIFWLTNLYQTTVPYIPLYPSDGNDIAIVIDDEYVIDEALTKTYKKWNRIVPEDSIIGIISLKMNVDNEDFSITYSDSGIQYIQDKQFYVRFENSKYFWCYQRKDIQENYLTQEKYPLVKKGIISIDPEELSPPIPSSYMVDGMKLPNPHVGLFEKRAEEIYSVIYI